MVDGGIPIGRGRPLEGEGKTVARVTVPVCRLIIMIRTIIRMIMMKIVTSAMMMLTVHHLGWVRVG